MRPYHLENLSHDAVHGYIPFCSAAELSDGETAEREIIDHPWVQRLRHIHQLQTAWWVFPTAEHTRFQHVLGVMHLASRAVEKLYDSLREVCPDVPSRGYVESLMRMAGLLHDVGHGPFGHFLDTYFLSDFGLTHETLGARIIESELGNLLRGVRRNPNSKLGNDETLEPAQIAWLIQRPRGNDATEQPRWLYLLRSLLSGIYTIDNLDFVLRDAYMSGYSREPYDLERLLHYSFFTDQGLTIHDRGISALVRFMGAKSDLFRSIYFHRTVKAIDLTLADLFKESKGYLFRGNPIDDLDAYQGFTESSVLVDVSRWGKSHDLTLRELGKKWRKLLDRQYSWHMVCERSLVFSETDRETSNIFSDQDLVASKLRNALPSELREVPLRVDIARHIHRPHTKGPASGQNFLYDSARDSVRPLTTNELFSHAPISHRICRVYAESLEHRQLIAATLDGLLGGNSGDDLTNM
ncbi:MAG: HD domain-containing protein [Planctomycetaceae bacterium]|nr:HD domain-containing protein [Planctomycetales bacterium]MCB9926919.1 HD domain-containing protein [Planctomycetaceae bacterium]